VFVQSKEAAASSSIQVTLSCTVYNRDAGTKELGLRFKEAATASALFAPKARMII